MNSLQEFLDYSNKLVVADEDPVKVEVSGKLNRNYCIIDINPKYIDMSENRVFNELGMFK